MDTHPAGLRPQNGSAPKSQPPPEVPRPPGAPSPLAAHAVVLRKALRRRQPPRREPRRLAPSVARVRSEEAHERVRGARAGRPRGGVGVAAVTAATQTATKTVTAWTLTLALALALKTRTIRRLTPSQAILVRVRGCSVPRDGGCGVLTTGRPCACVANLVESCPPPSLGRRANPAHVGGSVAGPAAVGAVVILRPQAAAVHAPGVRAVHRGAGHATRLGARRGHDAAAGRGHQPVEARPGVHQRLVERSPSQAGACAAAVLQWPAVSDS